MELHDQNKRGNIKLRSIGVRASSLCPEMGLQLSFYDNEKKQKREAAARAADIINSKFGRCSLVHGVTMIDKTLTSFIPKDEIT